MSALCNIIYPHATVVADGEYAQANTHVVDIVITCFEIKIWKKFETKKKQKLLLY